MSNSPLKRKSESDNVVHASNPSTREAEVKGSGMGGQPGLHSENSPQCNKSARMTDLRKICPTNTKMKKQLENYLQNYRVHIYLASWTLKLKSYGGDQRGPHTSLHAHL